MAEVINDGRSMGGGWLAAATLWQREMIGFVRQRGRVVSALVTPAIFWLLLGGGFDRVFVAGDDSAGYLQYFFPGVVVMILMFTAIFCSYSVIDDRNAGFLQGVLAAPIPRWSIVVGKVFGGATIATLQGLLFMLLWPMVAPSWPGWAAMGVALAMMAVLAGLYY